MLRVNTHHTITIVLLKKIVLVLPRSAQRNKVSFKKEASKETVKEGIEQIQMKVLKIFMLIPKTLE